MKKFKNKLYSWNGVIAHVIAVMLLTIKPLYNSWIFLINFKIHKGYSPDFMGYPRSYKEILAEAIFWILVLGVCLLILLRKKMAWYFFQILTSSSLIVIILNESLNVSKTIEYLEIKNVFIAFGLVWLTIYFRNKLIMSLFAISKKLKNYLFIAVGILLLLSIWLIMYW